MIIHHAVNTKTNGHSAHKEHKDHCSDHQDHWSLTTKVVSWLCSRPTMMRLVTQLRCSDSTYLHMNPATRLVTESLSWKYSSNVSTCTHTHTHTHSQTHTHSFTHTQTHSLCKIIFREWTAFSLVKMSDLRRSSRTEQSHLVLLINFSSQSVWG